MTVYWLALLLMKKRQNAAQPVSVEATRAGQR
jgi:hypothetical protein